MDQSRPTWSELPPAAKGFRLAHIAWGIVSIAALLDIWAAAMRGHPGTRPFVGAAWLVFEGILLIAGRGDCPAGPLQRRLGDPVPMFELVLTPRAAKAAIPALTVVAATGISLLVARRITCR